MRKRWINGTRSSHLWRSRHKPVRKGRVALLYRRETKRFINVRRFFIDSQTQSPPCPGMKPSPALLQSPRSAHCSPCPLGKHRALAPCGAHACSHTWDTWLHRTSVPAWSGAAQTEQKDVSSLSWTPLDGTTGEGILRYQLSLVASECGLGIGLSEFPSAPSFQLQEVQTKWIN